MKILYFDCFSGISGDMTISSLLSLTGEREKFLKRLEGIALHDYDAEITEVVKKGIHALGFKVSYDERHHHQRNLNDIYEIIDNSELENREKELAREIFKNLGQAESKVHNVSLEEVHFHEVGAVDSIIDVVGTSILINMVKPDRIVFSPVPVGGGYIQAAHCRLPVPAPATAELLKGIPVYDNGIRSELVTPTGAAIVKTLADEFGGMPSMVVKNTGYGSGEKDLEVPNILRTFLGEAAGYERDQVYLLETNIDDMNPESYEYVIDRLFAEGALDVFIQPVIMKKSRPAAVLSVICKREDIIKVEEIVFRETTSFGIRKLLVDRSKLKREIRTVETEYGPVNIKYGYIDGETVKAVPEYEDVKRAAQKAGRPFNAIYSEILALMRD